MFYFKKLMNKEHIYSSCPIKAMLKVRKSKKVDLKYKV